MEPAVKLYLDKYEEKLMQHMLKMLTSMELLQGKLLETEDLNDVWQDQAPAYLADAVKEITDYPNVALGWAMYFGMAVAHYWDGDWLTYGRKSDLYEYVRDARGFDYMDEYIREEVLGLSGDDYVRMEKTVQTCAQQVLSHIHQEHIDPQTPMAFHVFVVSIRVLYKLGVALELRRLGYKFEKMN